MYKISILIIGLFLTQTPLWSQGWVKTYYDYQSNWLNAFGERTLDDGYVMVGHVGSLNREIHVKKTDEFGNIQWDYTKNQVGNEHAIAIKQIPSTGGYVVLYTSSQTSFEPQLLRLDANGQLVYDLSLNIPMDVYTGSSNSDMIITNDEHLLISSSSLDTLITPAPTLGLAKLDLGGNMVWSQYYSHSNNYQTRPMTLLEDTDGNYLLAGTIDTLYNWGGGNGAGLYLVKTDSAGNELWRKTEDNPSQLHAHSAFNTNDGGFLLTGYQRGTGGDLLMCAAKLDANANPEWSWALPPGSASDIAFGAVENSDGSFTITGSASYGPPLYRQMALVKLSATGTLISNTHINIGSAVAHGKQIYSGSNGGYSIFGVDATGSFILTTDSLGVIYSNHVVGNYFHDINGNCELDAGEPAIANQIITAEKATESRFGVTDLNGAYSVELDTGTYSLSTPNLSPYWQFCQNPQTVTFTNFYSQDTLDFALELLDSCTFMEVDVSAPFLRRCFPSVYHVKYDNWGTEAAQNAYVELTLDPYLTFDSSSIAMTLQTGNVFRFDLGTVPSISGGLFMVHVTVDCDSTVLGQVHCVEAHIYPDTICTPNYWDGPIIQTTSSCANDSVLFTIRNIGTNMLGPQDYNIIEEHVMKYSAPFLLGAGAEQWVTIPAAPGATYRLEAEQASGYPPLLGDTISISNHVGCNTPPTINFPGIINEFYNGNSSPFISNDCQANIGAFDPNDKQAQPLGYGTAHYINDNIPINYKIRFQNTGTDTAFTVVVIDTIDVHLDPGSISMGASSHSYDWELRENGILAVTFDNIMLADSNVNEAASHGFFKFEIKQQPNNPIGTVITNRAGIYFDFNPPVITNETFHTIGDDFVTILLVSGTEELLEEGVSIQVFPNPFESSTTVQVTGKAYDLLEMEVFTITGQLVDFVRVEHGDRLVLRRGGLTAGVYFYRLKGDGVLLNGGRLVVR